MSTVVGMTRLSYAPHPRIGRDDCIFWLIVWCTELACGAVLALRSFPARYFLRRTDVLFDFGDSPIQGCCCIEIIGFLSKLRLAEVRKEPFLMLQIPLDRFLQALLEGLGIFEAHFFELRSIQGIAKIV